MPHLKKNQATTHKRQLLQSKGQFTRDKQNIFSIDKQWQNCMFPEQQKIKSGTWDTGEVVLMTHLVVHRWPVISNFDILRIKVISRIKK